jgi:hypothetical protein
LQSELSDEFSFKQRDWPFRLSRLGQQITAEAALNGIYNIRTSVPKEQMDSAEAVCSHKALAEVERAFRSIQSLDLPIRPIHHWLETRVRADMLLCLLAHDVEWYLREARRALLFANEDLKAKTQRNPVAPAKRFVAVLKKAATDPLDDGSPASSFQTLLQELSTSVRNTCQPSSGHTAALTFQMITSPNPTQMRAMQMLQHHGVDTHSTTQDCSNSMSTRKYLRRRSELRPNRFPKECRFELR